MKPAKSTVDRLWELFEANRIDELAGLIAPDCHFKMPGLEMAGRAPMLEMLRAYRHAFPDLRHTVKHSVESGDAIALELEVVGTHTGPMQTAQGTVPATGKQVVWDSCDYVRVKDGVITSWHVYHDPTPFLKALGAA